MQAAVAQEVLDQSQLWRTMVAKNQGIPFAPQPRNLVKDLPGDAAPATVPFPQTVTINNPPAEKAAGLGWLAKSAIGAALVGGGLGAGSGALVVGKAIYDRLTPAAAVAPVDESPVDPATGDLLQWLRENGFNLPPGVPDA